MQQKSSPRSLLNLQKNSGLETPMDKETDIGPLVREEQINIGNCDYNKNG